MDFHVFRSEKEPDVFGFTADDTGANLPHDLGPWAKLAGPAISAGGGDAVTGLSRVVAESIDRDGFYVARSETISHITGVPWVA